MHDNAQFTRGRRIVLSAGHVDFELNRSRGTGAGIIEEHIDTAEFFLHHGEQRLDRSLIGHIGRNRKRAVSAGACKSCGLGQRLGVPWPG